MEEKVKLMLQKLSMYKDRMVELKELFRCRLMLTLETHHPPTRWNIIVDMDGWMDGMEWNGLRLRHCDG